MTVKLDGPEVKDMRIGDRLRISGEGNDEFIVTRFGRFMLYVSTKYGFSYTRPQLIEKYSKVAQDVEIEHGE